MLSERSVELPWLIAHIGRPQKLLDIGSADAAYLGILYELCRHLYLCDTRPLTPIVPCQMFTGSAHQLPPQWGGMFDLVTCVSVLDHVGLDAYGNTTDDGLLPAVVGEIERVLAPGGRLLLTVPFGRAQVTKHPGGGQRIFDQEMLMGLFGGTRWRCESGQTWLLQDGCYAPVQIAFANAVEAGYAEWRAEACVGMELVKT